MATVNSVKRYTYTDYKNLDVDDHYIYELINGELVRKSAPSPRHQIILADLFRKIDSLVFNNKLGLVLMAPVDVFVDEYNAPQPDLLYIKNEHKNFITKDGVFGPPDLVVEIVSPGSITRDRIDKLRIYQRVGIPEFWIVDPKYISIEVYQLVAGEYQLFSFAVETGKIESKILEGFVLDINEVFAE